jgi:hypothetical protein
LDSGLEVGLVLQKWVLIGPISGSIRDTICIKSPPDIVVPIALLGLLQELMMLKSSLNIAEDHLA